ncbi:MAG: nitroreductase family protein [Candidatus Nealsonbacteria bacterium]|nr:nitroreductase family protein [Candidatus Nealsonbacteria bacterium]
MMSKEIKLLLECGVRAPSSHNSQPWLFRVDEKYIEIYADPKRRLSEADRDGRMLFVSLGCLIANLKIAADFLGLSHSLAYYTSGTSDLAARMNFFGEKKKANGDYFRATSERRSNRNQYKNRPIPEDVIRALKDLNRDEGLRIDFVTSYKTRAQIADISSRAMGRIMSRSPFRRELAHWLRTNITRKKDGMPGSGHGMSLLVSCIAPHILRHVDVSKVEAKKERKRIMNFPAVVVISSRGNHRQQWLKVGELLEMILLAAQSKSIDSAIRVASIEDQIAREELRQALGLRNFEPQMLFGLGYAEKTAPHSPRRRIEDYILPAR